MLGSKYFTNHRGVFQDSDWCCHCNLKVILTPWNDSHLILENMADYSPGRFSITHQYTQLPCDPHHRKKKKGDLRWWNKHKNHSWSVYSSWNKKASAFLWNALTGRSNQKWLFKLGLLNMMLSGTMLTAAYTGHRSRCLSGKGAVGETEALSG